jgi:hypothetical protein
MKKSVCAVDQFDCCFVDKFHQWTGVTSRRRCGQTLIVFTLFIPHTHSLIKPIIRPPLISYLSIQLPLSSPRTRRNVASLCTPSPSERKCARKWRRKYTERLIAKLGCHVFWYLLLRDGLFSLDGFPLVEGTRKVGSRVLFVFLLCSRWVNAGGCRLGACR